MNDKALTTNGGDPRETALLQAIGFDKLSPAQRELGLAISRKYDLDPMLKHVVLIEGRAYITRDGLLHIAHRSGQLDGIETSEPAIVDGFWRATCSVYRKDMSRPFTYTGRYPTTGGNQKFAPEMAVKVGEVMALRRAFDVAAPTAEERWDVPEAAVESASAEAPSLAARAAAKRAEIETATQEAPAEPADAPEVASGEGDESLPAALGRIAFLAALNEHNVTPKVAAERAAALFPGVDTKDLSDEQRGELLRALTEQQPEPTAA